MNNLIILDRDGVINYDSDNYIRSVAEFIPIKGSIKAIVDLTKAGFIVTVATNQSGIGRGYYKVTEFNKMCNKLNNLVEKEQGKIHHIAYCPHSPIDNCDCRKPKIGLYLEIAKKLNKNLSESIVIGDSLRDIEAGKKVGAKCFLVRTGKGGKTQYKVTDDIEVFDNLLSITQHLLNSIR